jgi:hypothetical protein
MVIKLCLDESVCIRALSGKSKACRAVGCVPDLPVTGILHCDIIRQAQAQGSYQNYSQSQDTVYEHFYFIVGNEPSASLLHRPFHRILISFASDPETIQFQDYKEFSLHETNLGIASQVSNLSKTPTPKFESSVYSTVTDLARLRGMSTLTPTATAIQ